VRIPGDGDQRSEVMAIAPIDERNSEEGQDTHPHAMGLFYRDTRVEAWNSMALGTDRGDAVCFSRGGGQSFGILVVEVVYDLEVLVSISPLPTEGGRSDIEKLISVNNFSHNKDSTRTAPKLVHLSYLNRASLSRREWHRAKFSWWQRYGQPQVTFWRRKRQLHWKDIEEKHVTAPPGDVGGTAAFVEQARRARNHYRSLCHTSGCGSEIKNSGGDFYVAYNHAGRVGQHKRLASEVCTRPRIEIRLLSQCLISCVGTFGLSDCAAGDGIGPSREPRLFCRCFARRAEGLREDPEVPCEDQGLDYSDRYKGFGIACQFQRVICNPPILLSIGVRFVRFAAFVAALGGTRGGSYSWRSSSAYLRGAVHRLDVKATCGRSRSWKPNL